MSLKEKPQTRFTCTMTLVEQFDRTDAPDFLNYFRKTLGTNNWALCRKTKYNLARYETCLSPSEYAALERQYLKDGGNPSQIWDDKIAEECGWVRRWVRIAPEAAA